ncbi:hypothetical protein F4805DRAFT_228904 [Annulohypoxylon moriforme]|nr:hypothetical protein F4805DRAFT_228904 [Annulohypoxylon moriforme]
MIPVLQSFQSFFFFSKFPLSNFFRCANTLTGSETRTKGARSGLFTEKTQQMRRRLKLTGISAQGRVETPQTSHHLQHTLIRSYGLLLAFAYGCVLCSCAEPPTPPFFGI